MRSDRPDRRRSEGERSDRPDRRRSEGERSDRPDRRRSSDSRSSEGVRSDRPERRGFESRGDSPRRSSQPRDRGKKLAEQSEGPQRLQKILAQAGIASRRACELLILEGRVSVDGKVVNELGARFDPKVSRISVDGQKIQPEEFVYYLVNKPKGYVSTSSDPSGRPLVLDLVPKAKERLFIVGRLDRFSEGLMLLTNDGALTQHLLHPKFGVEKTYRVTVAGEANQELIQKLTDGIWLAEGKVRARRARIVSQRGNASVLEIVLAEGKNREIRRMLARLEHKVLSLQRVSIGPLQIKGISEGNWRMLTPAEVDELRNYRPGDDRPRTARKPFGKHDQFNEKAGEKDFERPRRKEQDSERPARRKPERSTTQAKSYSERPRFEERRPSRFEENRPSRTQKPARTREFEQDETEFEELVFTDRMDFGDQDRDRSGPRQSGSEFRQRSDHKENPRGEGSGSSRFRESGTESSRQGGSSRAGSRPGSGRGRMDRGPRPESSERRERFEDRPQRQRKEPSEGGSRRSGPRPDSESRRTVLGHNPEKKPIANPRRPGGSLKPRKRR